MYVFLAIPLLFQRQKMSIVCSALGPRPCHLLKEEPTSRGEGGNERAAKPLTSLGTRRVGTWFHCSTADSGEELDHVISKGPSSLEKNP